MERTRAGEDEGVGRGRISKLTVTIVLSSLILGIAAIDFGLSHLRPVYVSSGVSSAMNIATEMLNVAICFSIFSVRWLTRKFDADKQSVVISFAFVPAGIFSIFRLLSYPGMPSAGVSGFNQSLWFDVLSRYTVMLALLAAVFISYRDSSDSRIQNVTISVFLAWTVAGVLLITLFSDAIPRLGSGQSGLSQLHIGIEYLAVIILVLSAVTYAWLSVISKEVRFLLIAAGLVIFSYASIAYSQTSSAFDSDMMIGRIASSVVYLVMFVALVRTALVTPYARLGLARDEMIRTRTELVNSYDTMQQLARDLVERRRAAAEITKLNKDLRAQTEELQAAIKSLETFSYSVSHDLRAPLRAIDGFSQALLQEHGDHLDMKSLHNLARIRKNCVHMGQLIDDLLQYSLVSRENMTRRNVDLSELARNVATELRQQEPSRVVNFIINKNLLAMADERLIRVVLEQLFDNAWKFTRKKSNALIEFGEVDGQTGEKVFYLKDNGAGFDMQYGHKLFTPFERLHSPDEFPGTGIGLATVQKIVERHHGRVWAEGREGEGATFYFTLGEWKF